MRTVAIAGLVAGTLDGIAAVVWYLAAGGAHPEQIAVFIASGVLGRAAFTAGPLMAPRALHAQGILIGAGILMVCVGLPIALITGAGSK